MFFEPKGLPLARVLDHHIPLKSNFEPTNQRPYRYPYIQRAVIEKLVQEILDTSIIQPSHSHFASPVLLVGKKDGTWRFCVNYKKLNEGTIKDKYPIPMIEKLLDELRGAQMFSKIDLRAGYHQVRVHPPDVYNTTFRTHVGHFKFKVMLFGLTNAPATFQALMNHMFQPYLKKFVLVFFDDILIYSPNLEAHVKHLNYVLQLLREHQLHAKFTECSFAQPQIEYLGHLIGNKGIAADYH